MLQQKAVVLGDLFVTVAAQISRDFPSFLFIPPFPWQRFFLSLPQFFPSPLFCSFSFCTSSFHRPSLFSSRFESLMSVYESIVYNSQINYLHNDLQVTKHFQIPFLFSFGWWDSRVRWIGLGCWYLFSRFFKKGLREVEWFARGRISKVNVRTFTSTQIAWTLKRVLSCLLTGNFRITNPFSCYQGFVSN